MRWMLGVVLASSGCAFALPDEDADEASIWLLDADPSFDAAASAKQ